MFCPKSYSRKFHYTSVFLKKKKKRYSKGQKVEVERKGGKSRIGNRFRIDRHRTEGIRVCMCVYIYVPPCHVDFSIAPTCWTPAANIRRSTLRCTRPRARSRTCPGSWSTSVHAGCANSPRGTPFLPSWPYFSGTRHRRPCLVSAWGITARIITTLKAGIFSCNSIFYTLIRGNHELFSGIWKNRKYLLSCLPW